MPKPFQPRRFPSTDHSAHSRGIIPNHTKQVKSNGGNAPATSNPLSTAIAIFIQPFRMRRASPDNPYPVHSLLTQQDRNRQPSHKLQSKSTYHNHNSFFLSIL